MWTKSNQLKPILPIVRFHLCDKYLVWDFQIHSFIKILNKHHANFYTPLILHWTPECWSSVLSPLLLLWRLPDGLWNHSLCFPCRKIPPLQCGHHHPVQEPRRFCQDHPQTACCWPKLRCDCQQNHQRQGQHLPQQPGGGDCQYRDRHLSAGES